MSQEIINQIIANMDTYFRTMGINVSKYRVDFYDLDGEIRPYIEVYVYVKDIKEMLRIWEKTIDFLRSTLGDSILENVDIFFTRELR